MVSYIRSDLEFILEQIKISEAHAAGQPLFGPGGLIPAYNVAWGLRTVDGSYNHLLPGQEHWGSADQPFPEGLGTDFRTVMVDADPGPGVMMMPVSYQPGVDNDGPGSAGPSDVFDPTVRTISNLIVDQTLDNPAAILAALERAGLVEQPEDQMALMVEISDAYDAVKPLFEAVTAAQLASAAATAAAAANPGDPALQAAAADAAQILTDAQAALATGQGVLIELLETGGIEMEGANVSLPNVAPDEGLSASFNSWFTLFGQFFDHGLDLVAKGGNGTVFIPLQPDDPLYVPGGHTNFMVMTRATIDPGPDGMIGTADDGRPINNTTPFVDQNQTYSSHPSHQVFLREYEVNAAGEPVATGRLIGGSTGGMATWADVKAQALMLGIELTDSDVGNIPLLRTDQYGNFIPDANGYAQVIVGIGADGIPNTADDDVVSGTPAAPVNPTTEMALRTGHAFLADIAHTAVPTGLQDGDIEVGLGNGDGTQTDGSYDNELLDAHFIAGDGRANENVGLTAVHHVFHSEHNRLVEHTKQVLIDDAAALLAGGASQADAVAFLNEWLVDDVATVPATPDGLVWDGVRIFQAAKFGTEMQYQHLVFEEFARKISPTINAFLVPDGFDATLDPSIVAEFAHVIYRFGHSMLTETVDRYDPGFQDDHISLIEAFLNPLQFENNGTGSAVDADIAAGAIIRGMTRQVGNEIDEFVTSALRNNLLGLPLDLATINLARGRDTGVPALNEVRRQFYEASDQNILLKPYASWVEYASHLKNESSIINFIAAYGTHDLIEGQTTIDGKRDAALTLITGQSVGGLSVPDELDRQAFLNGTGEYSADLGGLENVDLWIGGLAEEIMPFGGMLGSTFGYVFEIQLERLQSGDRFYYLQRLDGLHLFGEMENNSFASMIMRNTNATHLPSDVFSTPGLILEVDPSKQFNDLDGDGDLEGGDPVGSSLLTPLVIRNDPSTPGTDNHYLRYTGGDHVVLGGTDTDSTFNPGGNDILIGGIGDDTLYGDSGDDWLDGGFGNDIINGGDGDDIIVDAGGDDNIKGGAGNDVINAGGGLDLVLAGSGKDFVFLGTDEGSEVFAGTGDDFIYGNKNAERILGNEGNDWIETGTFDGAPGDNFDEIFARDGISGHDVFLGDGGFDEFIGEGGHDIMVGSGGRGKMAGMSGFDWATYKDHSSGVNADLSIPIVFDEAPVLPEDTALDEYASMEGLSGTAHDDTLIGSNEDAQSMAGGLAGGLRGSVLDQEGIDLIDGLQELLGAGVTSFGAGNIILGGGGSDTIAGGIGDDIIHGDKWLNVRISVRQNDDGTGPEIATFDSMTGLAPLMFNGTYNPGQLVIVREILDGAETGDIDTAFFVGNEDDYEIVQNADGSTTVTDTVGLEGTDTLYGIEQLQFGNGVYLNNVEATGAPLISDTSPTEGTQLIASPGSIFDANGIGSAIYEYQWQVLDGGDWENIPGADDPTFTPGAAQVGMQLRVVVSFFDDVGSPEQRISAPTDVVGDLFVDNGGTNVFDGTEGADNASGLGGNDLLEGNGGDDILSGGADNDTLEGGEGNDLLDGGSGDDTANGGNGNDTFVLQGTFAENTISGGGGDYLVERGGETDTLTSIEFFRLNGVDIAADLLLTDIGPSIDSILDPQTGAVIAVEENSNNGTVAANVTASDPQIVYGDALTYELQTTSGGVYTGPLAIDASGVITVIGELDFESATTEPVRVVVTDVHGNTAFQDVTVTIEDLNDNAPIVTSADVFTVAENETIVGTVTSSDADTVGGPAEYSISGGADAGSFAIDAGTGALTFITAPDFDAGQTAFEVEVSVSDGVATTSQTITVGVTDVNDIAPVITSSSAFTVAENETAVGTVTSTDADTVGGPAEYSISGGADAAKFTIDANSGVLTFVTAPDFEAGQTSFEIEVAVSDGVNATMQAVTIDLTNINEGFGSLATQSVGVEAGSTAAPLGLDLIEDPDGDPMSYEVTGLPAAAAGTLMLNGMAVGMNQLLSEAEFQALTFASSETPQGTVMQFAVSDGTNVTSLSINVAVTPGVDGTFTGTPDGDFLDGAAGNDTINGLASKDLLIGGSGNDVVSGEAGADDIFGNAGDDTLNGGDGADTMNGGDGADEMVGGRGQDTMAGGLGSDSLKGGSGNDMMSGGANADRMIGGSGNDNVVGGNGSDDLFGNDGNDVLEGGNGHDMLIGGRGADLADGGTGNDVLNGNGGSDTLFGRDGNDQLFGGRGIDDLVGEAGDDQLFGDNGHDVLDGGSGEDVLEGGSGSDLADGGSEDDVIRGNGGNDTLFGRGGNDLLVGGKGSDDLSGGGGNDELFGSESHDILRGASGDDLLTGGNGKDTLIGGGGSDMLLGGAGKDDLTGSKGADTFKFTKVTDSGPAAQAIDIVRDLKRGQGDKIDVSGIDARTDVGGNQAFSFIGLAGFSGQSGEMRFEQTGGDTFVYADVDGDGAADFGIRIKGEIDLQEADFTL